jgi:hypothetical protein
MQIISNEIDNNAIIHEKDIRDKEDACKEMQKELRNIELQMELLERE